ncbi:MAG: sigma-70 family RNA polymerase sigma factor [Cyclobacteriaceae bacterium]|nr:sigma-70 family RNA polymerase sigma factor [Cyclobacteriaceae bacterium]
MFSRNSDDEKNTDEWLVHQYKESESLEILGTLFNRYIHLVYGVCLKYLKNREDSQDEVMQIFEKLATQLKEHDVGNFKGWLYVLTKNHCLMLLRKRKSQGVNEVEFIPEYNMESGESMHLFDEESDEHLKDRLQKCIEKLKDEQKACVTMFYIEEKCYQEIGEIKGYDIKKVKSYIQNGKRNLKLCIENSEQG